jgi:hypothetical protein
MKIGSDIIEILKQGNMLSATHRENVAKINDGLSMFVFDFKAGLLKGLSLDDYFILADGTIVEGRSGSDAMAVNHFIGERDPGRCEQPNYLDDDKVYVLMLYFIERPHPAKNQLRFPRPVLVWQAPASPLAPRVAKESDAAQTGAEIEKRLATVASRIASLEGKMVGSTPGSGPAPAAANAAAGAEGTPVETKLT